MRINFEIFPRFYLLILSGESVYAYENIFGMSMTKDKKAIRIKFMDRSGSKSLILESRDWHFDVRIVLALDKIILKFKRYIYMGYNNKHYNYY